MNNRFLLPLFLFLCAAAGWAQPSHKALAALMDDDIFTVSDASLVVYDLSADSLIFAHREHKLSRPASLLKLVTSVAAVERLGCEYTMDTRLLQNGRNLYLQGAVDALFSYDDLCSLLNAVPVGSVVDTLFADCSFMDSVYWGPGWAWDDTPWEFQPYISPLMLCGGCVEVQARPAERGLPPLVECYPPSAFYTVVNEAVSGAGDKRFTIMRDWLDGTNVIRLRGNCNAPKSEKMNIIYSQDYFMAVAAEYLAQRGVVVRAAGNAAATAGCTLLGEVRRPVTEIVQEALLESDNLCAEALLYHLGSLYGRRPVSRKMGVDILKGFLESTFDMPELYDICDGSGLSPYTFVSADILLQVLKYAYNNEPLFDILLQGLPVAGVSGTMKHRLKGGEGYKKVFAKTGTVTGVCTLAGYARASNGNMLAFVIMNKGLPKARAARAWQDKVCNLLCR